MPQSIADFWNPVHNWLNEPFRQPVSAFELFAGIGLILFILFAWGRITTAIGSAV